MPPTSPIKPQGSRHTQSIPHSEHCSSKSLHSEAKFKMSLSDVCMFLSSADSDYTQSKDRRVAGWPGRVVM